MRTRIVFGSIAALVIALSAGVVAQRAGGPPPPVNQQGEPGQVGPAGPGGIGPQQGQQGGQPGMPGNANGPYQIGMRGRGQNGPNGQGPQNGQMNGPGRGGRGGPSGPGLAELNLTPEQQASVARIRLDAADASATLAGQGHELRDELHRATFADTKDAAKLTDLTTRILAIEKQLIEIQTKAQTETATVLTAEQRKKMRVVGGGPGRR